MEQVGGDKVLKTENDKRICEHYSARDAEGLVHCYECPLTLENNKNICKAIAHYDKKKKAWVVDEKYKGIQRWY